MWLQMRMYLLVGLMFGIVYAVIVGVGSALGMGGLLPYLILSGFFVVLQYLLSPAIVGWSMKVKYLSEEEAPDLHRMVAELAQKAHLPKPKIGISELEIPNAFAFGRSQKDARVCVTRGIMNLLNKDELRAVMGHEISHIKHRDMAVITILSIVPMVLWYIAWGTMWSGGNRRGNNAALIGLAALLLYFISNLLVLWGSRIREYYADEGSVKLGNPPHHLASALYRLVYGSARIPKETLKKAEGFKAFFVNDPSNSWNEIKELKQIDRDMSGTINYEELAAIRSRQVTVGGADKMMEIMSTHPNMLKRIKHLSTLMFQ